MTFEEFTALTHETEFDTVFVGSLEKFKVWVETELDLVDDPKALQPMLMGAKVLESPFLDDDEWVLGNSISLIHRGRIGA